MATVNIYQVGRIVINEVIIDEELSSDELKEQRMQICNPCEYRVDVEIE